jgi:hypothetical protein
MVEPVKVEEQSENEDTPSDKIEEKWGIPNCRKSSSRSEIQNNYETSQEFHINVKLSNEKKLDDKDKFDTTIKMNINQPLLDKEKQSDSFDLHSEIPRDERKRPIDSIRFERFTEKSPKSQKDKDDFKNKIDESQEYRSEAYLNYSLEKAIQLLDPQHKHRIDDALSDRPDSAKIREERKTLEKGLFGLRVELRNVEEEIRSILSRHENDINEIREEISAFKEETKANFIDTNQLQNNRYTEFKGHINSVLLEYKDSILIIQSYVDNQLVLNKR